jgi:hypothetical protein
MINEDNNDNHVNDDNHINLNKHIIEQLAKCIECMCCFPITLYGFYLACKTPYKYEPIIDRPTIEAFVDHFI